MENYGQEEDRQPSDNDENSEVLMVDDPIPGVRRLTMNRPCLLYTSPSPRDISGSRMPSSA